MQHRHILLCGGRGAGKSTLIKRLLEHNALPVYGFYTRRLDADETGFHPIYIHPAGEKERLYAPQNLVGTCNGKAHDVSLEAFDTLGVRYIAQARPGGLIVMDELGFMEARAQGFTQAVMDAMDGGIPVIAAVKARYDMPFLNAVRAHPNAAVYDITADNRDALYDELLPVVLAWNAAQLRPAP